MSPEQKKIELSAAERFRVLKMTLESVFFQTEAFSERERDRPKMFKGLAGVAVLALAQFLLLSFWAWRDVRPLEPQETVGVTAVAEYARLWRAGDLGGMFVSFKTDDGRPLSPLYYWLALPAVRLLPVSPEKAMLVFNSFYLGLIGLFAFLIVRYNRVDKSGWLAAVFATCLPFVLSSARMVTPDIAVIAWAAGCYAAFIWSEDFSKPKPSYWFGTLFMCGLLTSWVFPLYVLPLLLYFVSGLIDRGSRKMCFYILALNALIFAAWLWINLPSLGMWSLKAAAAPGESAPLSALGKLTWHFWQSIDSAGLPMFLIGVLLFVWMLTAEFMPFPRRRILFNWLAVTYCILVFVPVKEARLYWPALVALAPAVGIMTPRPARIAVAGICALLALLAQSGFVGLKRISLFGHPVTVLGSETVSRDDGLRNLFAAAIKYLPESAPLNTAVAVNSSQTMPDAWLGAQALACGFGKVVFVADTDSFLKYPAIVVWLKNTGAGAPAQSGGRTVFSTADPTIPQNWFNRHYESSGWYDVTDPVTRQTSPAVLFGLRKSSVAPFGQGVVVLGDVKLGSLELMEARLLPGVWDPAAGHYKTALLSASVARSGRIDFYGVTLELRNFHAALDNGVLRVFRLDKVNVKRGLLSSMSVASYIEERFSGGTEARAQITPAGIEASFDYHGYPVDFECGMEIKGDPPGPEFVVSKLSVRGVPFPAFMARTQKYALDMRPRPCRPFVLEFGPAQLAAGSVKIGYEKSSAERAENREI
ncbi:MAG: hypothetical protein PHW69_08800 [Elusimicrobiaceae bacterium]|nr:hypothetical protein [Elusimicrobiaceae bacterium]